VNETMVTVCGNVALEPRHIIKENGLRITSFRVASTARRFDPEQKRWMDGETTWLGVSCFRALAVNVAASVHKGDRVIVSGRLRTRRWEKEERSGVSADLEAMAVGHDLAWGTSTFSRTPRAERAPGRAEADELAMALEQEMWNVDAVTDPPADGAGDGAAGDGAAGDGAAGGRRGGGKAPLEVVGS